MEKLILLVSEYLCLYQMELPEYNNIVMKNNAWRNISFAMRLPYYFSVEVESNELHLLALL